MAKWQRNLSDLFQSTLPHGSDRSIGRCCGKAGHFNPRSLTGATKGRLASRPYFLSFQSTLPHGSDFSAPITGSNRYLFQSTLPHGSDKLRLIWIVQSENFNPRSLTGATSGVRTLPTFVRFQSTLPHGSDVSTAITMIMQLTISIHAPSRERLFKGEIIMKMERFQSTLPHGSDSIKTKYFYIHLNQVFIAN